MTSCGGSGRADRLGGRVSIARSSGACSKRAGPLLVGRSAGTTRSDRGSLSGLVSMSAAGSGVRSTPAAGSMLAGSAGTVMAAGLRTRSDGATIAGAGALSNWLVGGSGWLSIGFRAGRLRTDGVRAGAGSAIGALCSGTTSLPPAAGAANSGPFAVALAALSPPSICTPSAAAMVRSSPSPLSTSK